MPLRRELSPFLFGGLVGCVFGLLLTPNRFQVIFRRQVKIGDALKCGHSATPKKRGCTNSLSPVGAGDGRGDNTAYPSRYGPLFRFAHSHSFLTNTPERFRANGS